MKYFHLAILTLSLLISQNANACSHPNEIENKRELTKFIQTYFAKNEDGNLRVKLDLRGTPEFKTGMNKFIELYPYDYESKYLFAEALLYENDNGADMIEGMKLYGASVVSECIHSGKLEFAEGFLFSLMGMEINNQPLEPIIRDIFSYKYFSDYDTLVRGNIKTKFSPITNKGGFLNRSEKLFSLISRLDGTSVILDSLFFILDFDLNKTVLKKGHDSIMVELSERLYKSLGKEASPLIKCGYAEYSLYRQSKFKEAIDIYAPALGTEEDINNLCQHCIHHNKFALCLFATGQFKESAREFKRSYTRYFMQQDDDGAASIANILAGNFNDNDIQTIKKLINLSREERNKLQIIIHKKLLDPIYVLALTATGKNEELKDYYRENIEKSLRKDKERSNLIRTIVEEERSKKIAQEENSRRHIEKRQQHTISINTNSNKPIANHSSPLSTASNAQITSSDVTTPLSDAEAAAYKAFLANTGASSSDKGPSAGGPKPKVEDGPVYEKKEKKKTRGIGNDEFTPARPSVIPTEEPLPYISISRLTSNKQAQKTFSKLFDKYRKGIDSDSNVKISLIEISAFFLAIRQEYAPHEGKGSHKKWTANLKAFDIAMEEQMVILTNKTYLKPEQIKAIREIFIEARILPEDEEIIEKLKKAKLI